jgi:hypothetical protein
MTQEKKSSTKTIEISTVNYDNLCGIQGKISAIINRNRLKKVPVTLDQAFGISLAIGKTDEALSDLILILDGVKKA